MHLPQQFLCSKKSQHLREELVSTYRELMDSSKVLTKMYEVCTRSSYCGEPLRVLMLAESMACKRLSTKYSKLSTILNRTPRPKDPFKLTTTSCTDGVWGLGFGVWGLGFG